MTFSKCEHIELEKMTDEEIKSSPWLEGYTEYHGTVKMICCKECYEKFTENKNVGYSTGVE